MDNIFQVYGDESSNEPTDLLFELDSKIILGLYSDGRITYPGTPDEATRKFLECLRRIYPDWIKKNGGLHS